MVLTDKKYPNKLAKIYLDDIHNGFVEELKSHYGTHNVDYRSKIETIEEPYYFIKFGKSMKKFVFGLIIIIDRYIKKKKADFQDTRSNENMERLKTDLYNLQNIMSQNIDLILDRDKNLDSIK